MSGSYGHLPIGEKINLRAFIEKTIEENECKKHDLTSDDYDKLERADIYFQDLSTCGRSYVMCYHWSIISDLNACRVYLDTDYVRDHAVFFAPNSIDAKAGTAIDRMVSENLAEYSAEYIDGARRVVVEAEDYPLEIVRDRYLTFMEKSKKEFLNAFSSNFSSFDGNIQKLAVNIATAFDNHGYEYKQIAKFFAKHGAIVKDNIEKNTKYLLVDTEKIEKLRSFVERNWRLEQGDVKETSKIVHPMIERALSCNQKGSDIKIVSLQEGLRFFDAEEILSEFYTDASDSYGEVTKPQEASEKGGYCDKFIK